MDNSGLNLWFYVTYRTQEKRDESPMYLLNKIVQAQWRLRFTIFLVHDYYSHKEDWFLCYYYSIMVIIPQQQQFPIHVEKSYPDILR